MTRLDGWRRLVALVPTLYLGAFVWENLLVGQSSGATRLILLGALPRWPHSANWGYGPSGALGVVLVIVLILVLLGRI